MDGVHGHAADIIHVIDAIAINGVNGALAPLLKRLMLMAMLLVMKRVCEEMNFCSIYFRSIQWRPF